MTFIPELMIGWKVRRHNAASLPRPSPRISAWRHRHRALRFRGGSWFLSLDRPVAYRPICIVQLVAQRHDAEITVTKGGLFWHLVLAKKVFRFFPSPKGGKSVFALGKGVAGSRTHCKPRSRLLFTVSQRRSLLRGSICRPTTRNWRPFTINIGPLHLPRPTPHLLQTFLTVLALDVSLLRLTPKETTQILLLMCLHVNQAQRRA